MKKLLIFVLILVALTAVVEIILPRIFTQTFYLIDAAPNNPPVTMPHWLIERWLPRYNIGLAITLGLGAIYVLRRKNERGC